METEMRIPFNSRVEGVLTGEGRTAKCSVMVNKVIDNDGSERTVSEYISDVKPPLQDGLYTLSYADAERGHWRLRDGRWNAGFF
jgi:hypothetical protein